jgi:two-component system, OmpR family, phosphate regulon response regulator PhoB
MNDEKSLTSPNLISARILIVEDEALIRETITLALSDEGYGVTAVPDGRMALDVLQSGQSFDLLILDLMLPGANGLDICRLLRHQNNLVPILILSAKSTETDRVVGLEVGADDYLPKPFGMRELTARCRALIRRQQKFQSEAGDRLSHGDISLYTQECRVTIADRAINLSPKEFKLLELFMNHPKRVWSREQLLEKIWGHDFIGDSKTVDVHIRWLREKLEKDPSSPTHLITVRGFGYRFG